MKYIEALKGWRGYKKSELIKGKYRPIFFSKLKYYSSSKSDRKDVIRVLATKENLRKTAEFNINYGAESYQKAGRRLLKKVM